jgi:hypothetical protein
MPFSCLRFLAPIFRYHSQPGLEGPLCVLSFLLLLLLLGWDWVHLALRPLLAYCTSPRRYRWWWLWSNWWNKDWQGKPKYWEKTCPSATLSTTYPTWPDPGLNLGRRGGKPATNRLSYGVARVSFFSHCGGGGGVQAGPTWHVGHWMTYCTSPGWFWWWRSWWNEDCPSSTLSTTNPTWPDPGLNLGRRGGKPATNRLSYGAVSRVSLVRCLPHACPVRSISWIATVAGHCSDVFKVRPARSGLPTRCIQRPIRTVQSVYMDPVVLFSCSWFCGFRMISVVFSARNATLMFVQLNNFVILLTSFLSMWSICFLVYASFPSRFVVGGGGAAFESLICYCVRCYWWP